MFETIRATAMYKWIQAMSLHFCAIACLLELRERFDGKVVAELKEELSKLMDAHSDRIHLLEDNLKKAEDKCSAKKEEKVKEKSFQDYIATLEGKVKEQVDFYATEVAELKEALAAKMDFSVYWGIW